MTEEILSGGSHVEPREKEFATVQEQMQETMQEQLFRRLRPDRFVTPKQVSVVIPTLNEKEGIGKVIDDLKAAGFDRILVVDGYSDDGTAAIAESGGAAVIHQHGPGKAGALITAIDAVVTPYLLVMDGDDTYKATDALRLLEHAADFDEIIGARRRGKDNIPFINRVGNWIISKTFKLFFDLPITDVLSGMYLLRTERAREIGITSTSFEVEGDIAAAMASTGRITEVPITYGDRLGKQKLKARDGGRIISTLFWMAYYYNSVLLYAGIVSLAAIPGAAVLIWALYEKMATNVWHGGYALVGVLLVLFATQGIGAGIGSLQTKRAENRILRELRQVRM
jgi:glycosyltransferase involved in cell wall biosynthesis